MLTVHSYGKSGKMSIYIASRQRYPLFNGLKYLSSGGRAFYISSFLTSDGIRKVPSKVTKVKCYTRKAEHQGDQNNTSIGHKSDIYGPADPVSNIPPIKFAITENETSKEKKFREFKEDLVAWHQQFWLNHNENFKKSKKAYLRKRVNLHTRIDEKQHADDLSIFYKDFLDKNWRTHLNYQREWYKKNFKVLWYGLQVKIERLFTHFQVKNSNSNCKN